MIIMDVEKYKDMTAPCFRDSDPPCTSTCPLHMDVRTFISKMKAGKYKAAYRAYRPKVVFPGIVSSLCPEPCMKSCSRVVKGKGPVRMRELEAFCFEQCVQKPDRYRLAKKEESVAVIGGGLSGLSCAYRLSSRGYHVTVFEKRDMVGGLALELMDPEKAVTDIQREFSELDVCTFETGHEADANEPGALLSSFNAVYIATGKGGPDFGLSLRDRYMTDMPGVFMGGLITGEKNQIEAMADGFNAAEYIELYFKLGDGAVPDFDLLGSGEPDERFYDLDYEDSSNSDEQDPASFDPEAEASKCYECNCDNCFKVCTLMQQVKKYPKKMTADTIATLRPNKYSRTGVRMIMGCTFCGKCKDVCPAGIDMGLFYKLARKDYYEDGTVPESFHEFWLKDMDFSLSDEACALHTPDRTSPSKYVFFPGCQLSGMFPGITQKTYDYMKSCAENTSIYLGCCGVPGEWAGADDRRKEATDRIKEMWEKLGHPVLVTACTTCRKNLGRYCPEIETATIYSFMEKHSDALPSPLPDADNNKYRIFDPCGAAGDDDTTDAVRYLTERCGIKAEECGSLPGCCGYGGHIYPANPGLQNVFADAAAGKDGATVITYCANCKDTFIKNSNKSIHLLELIFGDENSDKMPTLGQRRDNRRILKQNVLSEEIMPYNYTFDMVFTDEALAKMQKNLILEEDVDTVLKEKPSFSDLDTGTLYTRKQLGKVTIWVAYKEEEGRRVITDVYKHRVEVQE